VTCFLFFFSSRRRHTRSKRDWSSDVCSSDLSPALQSAVYLRQAIQPRPCPQRHQPELWKIRAAELRVQRWAALSGKCAVCPHGKIGRASCRERVAIAGDEEAMYEEEGNTRRR